MFLPFLNNPFATKNLAREDFRDLMADHLALMSGQNQTGQYTDLITALAPTTRPTPTFWATRT